MRGTLFILFLGLLTFGCIASSHHVCPDGTVVSEEGQCEEFSAEFNIDPNDYISIELKENEVNYVKAKGEMIGLIQLEYGEGALLGVRYPESWGFFERELRFPVLVNLDLDKLYSDVDLKVVGPDIYSFNVSAGGIPGQYRLGYGGFRNNGTQFSTGYDLIVIDEVVDEHLAYPITDRFIYSKTKPFVEETSGRVIQNWEVVEKSAELNGGVWEVKLKIEYDKCGIDWEAEDCITGNVVTGHYLIDKKTGLIVG